MTDEPLNPDVERELRLMLSGIITGLHAPEYVRRESFFANLRAEKRPIGGFGVDWTWNAAAERARIRLAKFARDLEPELDEAIDGFDSQIGAFLQVNALNEALFDGGKVLADGRTLLSALQAAESGGLGRLWLEIRNWLRRSSSEWFVLHPISGVKHLTLKETSRVAGLFDPSQSNSYEHVTAAFSIFGGWNAADGSVSNLGNPPEDQSVDCWVVARVRALQGEPHGPGIEQMLVTLGLLSCSGLPTNRHELHRSAAKSSRKILCVPVSGPASLSVRTTTTIWHRPPGGIGQGRQSRLERWSRVLSQNNALAIRLRVSLLLFQQALTHSSSAQVVVGIASLDALFGAKGQTRRSISDGLQSIGMADQIKRFHMLYNLRSAISHGESGSVRCWSGREAYLESYGADLEHDLLFLVGTAIAVSLDAAVTATP